MLANRADRVGVMTAVVVVIAWQALPFAMFAGRWAWCAVVEQCPPSVGNDFEWDWRISAIQIFEHPDLVQLSVLAVLGFVAGMVFARRHEPGAFK